jgi:hypothetical protein
MRTPHWYQYFNSQWQAQWHRLPPTPNDPSPGVSSALQQYGKARNYPQRHLYSERSTNVQPYIFSRISYGIVTDTEEKPHFRVVGFSGRSEPP